MEYILLFLIICVILLGLFSLIADSIFFAVRESDVRVKKDVADELQPPLYGHNLLEWRVGDRVENLEVVSFSSNGEGKVLTLGEYVDTAGLKWFNEDGHVGASGDWNRNQKKLGSGDAVLKITHHTVNVSLQKRKAKEEYERLQKEAEFTIARAEAYQAELRNTTA